MVAALLRSPCGVAQKKRHKPHFHSVTLAPRIIERY